MIIEHGVVVATEAGDAWVQTRRKTACGGCNEQSGCGVGAIDRWLGLRATVVRVANPDGATVGEEVRIGLDERALVIASGVVYLLPLLGLLLGGVLTQWWIAPMSEWPLAAGAALGFVAALAGARRLSKRLAEDLRYKPVILRRGGVT